MKQRPYRLPHAYWEEVKQELNDMLTEGVIEPSQSDWASPIVLVRKKDNSIRLCVDYRKLNAQSKKQLDYLSSLFKQQQLTSLII